MPSIWNMLRGRGGRRHPNILQILWRAGMVNSTSAKLERRMQSDLLITPGARDARPAGLEGIRARHRDRLPRRLRAPRGRRARATREGLRSRHAILSRMARHRRLAVLDRPGRHVHGHHRPRARRAPACRQAPLGRWRRDRSRRRRHPRAARARKRRRGAHRIDPHRHDGRDQCAARAPRRADRAGHDRGVRRRARDRLPEPAAPVRPSHRAAGTALCRGRRGRGAGDAPRASCSSRSTRRGSRRTSGALLRAASRASRSSSCTGTGIPRMKVARRRLRVRRVSAR